jgi:LysM repeat protein
MKIIRVFGVVVGIHLFALMLIFANPGCSSTSKPAPTPADTAAAPNPATPGVSVPLSGNSSLATESSLTAAPLGAEPMSSAVGGVRFTPTRPGTPAASALEAAPMTNVTPATTYVVVKNDNLSSIAKKNHLTVTELAAANNIKVAQSLRLGQKLIIPGKAPAGGANTSPAAAPAKATTPSANAALKPAGDAVSHTVKMGESLGAIARKYGVRQGDIAVANNITDPQKITAGQILTIPAPTAASKAKAAGKPADTAKAPEPMKPLFVVPPVEQDLDAGLKPATGADVPVIKVEEAPAPKL